MDALRVTKAQGVILERQAIGTEGASSPLKKQRLTGTIHLTPHHLFFSPEQSTSASNTPAELWIPYPAITLLTRLPQTLAGLYPVQVRTRTFESWTLLFQKERGGGAEDVWQSINDSAVISSVEQLYAFFYTLPSTSQRSLAPQASSVNPLTPSASSGWSTFNTRAELARQGVGSRSRAWRFTDINKDYSFCPTYPAKLVVPSRISDSILTYAGKYRSKGRIPALTYLHWANQASITRSSQPMVGLKQARSSQDERLVECIFTSHQSSDPVNGAGLGAVYGSTTTNLIVDARPTTNAMANVAMGAGTENMDNYRAAKKAYLGIDNIHVMRNSLKTVTDALSESETSGVLDRAQLRRSNWLKHMSSLLDGTLIIVRNVHLNASHVLVHCSDGWDRTSQLSATAQVCLDPYYRTFEGFKVLIEKDWLAFGHKFLDRSGHLSTSKQFTVAEVNGGEDESDEEVNGAQKAAQAFFASVQKQFSSSNSHQKEVSPVFHQFLDCVWQIQRQFPNRFEFTEQWLLDLYEHLYACQFGTFVFNSERERRMTPPTGGKPYIDRTISAWDFFDKGNYVNHDYDSTLDDRESRNPTADQGVLLPDSRDVRFWHGLFRRNDEDMNGGLRIEQIERVELVGPIQAGQMDPVSAEGIGQALKQGAGDAPGDTSLSNRNADPLTDFDNQLRLNQSGSTARKYPTASPLRPSTPGKQTVIASNSGKGGWGWSQLGSGALSALQGAAKEMRIIGQDAYNQIRAEAGEVEGEMWTRSNSATRPDEPQYRGSLPVESSRSGLATPSNPWVANSDQLTQLPVDKSLLAPAPTGHPPTSRPGPGRESSWTVHPSRGGSPSRLEDLILGDASSGSSPQTHDGISSRNSENEVEIDYALGGERKAWDPLGAL